MDVQRLTRIQRAHHARFTAIQVATADLVGEAWDTFGGLDDTALRRFAAAATVIVDEAKAQTTTVAAGYMAANDAIAAGQVSGFVPDVPVIRNGVPTVDVYARSVVEARVRISRDATFDDAMGAGRARATGTAMTDVSLTNKGVIDAADRFRPWVVGYRRVLTGRSCGFCARASTQRYKRPNLLPLHQRCDCDVAEIYGTADPGQVINRDLNRAIKQSKAVDNRYLVDADGNILSPDGKHAIEVAVKQQPEIGPVLVAA